MSEIDKFSNNREVRDRLMFVNQLQGRIKLNDKNDTNYEVSLEDHFSEKVCTIYFVD